MLNGKITSLSVLQKSPDQVSCDVAGEAVVLNVKSGMYFGMEHTGALIWSLLDEPRTFGDVREAILHEYNVDIETCERDLMTFLKEMTARGLIEIQDEANS